MASFCLCERRKMFYKQLKNGKYRYFEKFYDKKKEEWRQVTVTLNSKTRVSQAEARNQLALKINELQKELTAQEIRLQEMSKITVQEVFDEWSAIRKQELKISTYYNQRGALKSFLSVYSEDKIQDITTYDLQSFLSKLDTSNATKRNKKKFLRYMFDYAKNIGYVKENPAENIVLPRERTNFEMVEKSREKFLSKEEMKKVLEYIRGKNKKIRYALSIEFIYLTGCRYSEFASLRYQDIDFDEKLLKINHSLEYREADYNDRVLQSTKTPWSVRTISLNNRCMEIIDYFRNNCLDEKFIFVDDKGSLFSNPMLRRFIRENCQDVLGKERNYTLHMLRHSHISLLAELGVPIKAIMERVGHHDEKITLNVYSHVTATIKSDITQKLNTVEL